MDSCKFTPFGLCVKTELLKRGKEQKWLQEEITAITGLYVDSGYMHKILTGQRNAPRVVAAICDILDIQYAENNVSPYRKADSYYNRASRGKVSNKYVYDFLQTQALGDLHWVGLTGALGKGGSTANWSPPYPMAAPTNSSGMYDCDTGFLYWFEASRGSNSDAGYFRLKYMDTFSYSAAREVDLKNLLGISFNYSYSVSFWGALDWDTKQIYGIIRYCPSGSSAYINRAFRLSADLTTVEARWTVSGTWPSSGYGGYRDGMLYFLAENSTNTYNGFDRYEVDLAAGTVEKIYVAYTEDPACNVVRFAGFTHYYKNYFWRSPYMYNNYLAGPDYTTSGNYFCYVSPMYDLSTMVVVSSLPPAIQNRYSNDYRIGRCPISLYAKQWGRFYYNGGAPSIPFAYTCYRLPTDAPKRPAGTGMTITYELDITW